MRRSLGFTMVELMIVVAVIGILAAVGLPAYQDYTVRAKMSEVVLAGSSGRTAVATAYSELNTMSKSAATMGVVSQSSKYVASVTYEGTSDTVGNIIVTTNASGSGLPAAVADKTIVLRGTANTSTGQVVWRCGGGTDPVPERYRPSSCRDF